MTVYLGRPGSLVALPSTGLSISPTVERVSESRTTIGGGRSRDYAPGVLRTWVLRWNVLDRALYGALEAFFAGLNGPGPFVFLDPGRTNLLTPNQSGTTSVNNDTAGFLAFGGETLTSATTPVERGPRSLAWSLPAAVTAGFLVIGSSNSDWPGIPVVPGRSYRLIARVRGGGTDPIALVSGQLGWMNAAGGQFQFDTGAGTATSAGAWADVACTFTAPGSAWWVQPKLLTDAASVSAAATVYVDKLQLAMPDALDDGTVWRPGLGVPRVTLPQLDDSPWWSSLHKTGLVLEEVA
ncbi:hypothetical protein GCM10018962_77060 [Dactylosporangium matsuzakiense]|uniref:hypothetical protein n=1 Tax=Dactylosporangium matsuzakiense TaxID=53360 RepID=UPI0031EA6BAE